MISILWIWDSEVPGSNPVRVTGLIPSEKLLTLVFLVHPVEFGYPISDIA